MIHMTVLYALYGIYKYVRRDAGGLSTFINSVKPKDLFFNFTKKISWVV
jgi:hypothetical protein